MNGRALLRLLNHALDEGGAIGSATEDIDTKIYLGSSSAYALFDYGDKAFELHGATRINLSGVVPAATTTDGAVIKIGSSTTPASTPLASTAASQTMHREIYGLDHTGCYGVYHRSYIRTAAISSDASRLFATVLNVAAGTVRGLHCSLSFDSSGTVSGLGCAAEFTLHMPSTAGMAGTCYAIKAAINADASTSDPVGATTIAFIGFNAQGDATGLADLDTDGVLIDVTGLTAATGTTKLLSSTSLNELPAGTVGLRCKVGGSLYYLPLVAAAEWN